MKRVLITAPLKQSPKIFQEFQESLDKLVIPGGVKVDRFFVVNDCPEIYDELHDAEFITINTGDIYQKTHNDHIWTSENLGKMPKLRNATINCALDGNYDFWFSVDTDLVLHPDTLRVLLDADKEIVSEVFWTQSKTGAWWCNAWEFDQADANGRLPEFAQPGLDRVGMTGACTLAKTDVFRRGVSYDPIPNIRKALFGEDRWFCIRAAVLGVEMWLDTHCPAEHLFTDAIYREYMRRKTNA